MSVHSRSRARVCACVGTRARAACLLRPVLALIGSRAPPDPALRRVQFDRRELGVEMVADVDVMPCDPLEALPPDLLAAHPNLRLNGRSAELQRARAAQSQQAQRLEGAADGGVGPSGTLPIDPAWAPHARTQRAHTRGAAEDAARLPDADIRALQEVMERHARALGWCSPRLGFERVSMAMPSETLPGHSLGCCGTASAAPFPCLQVAFGAARASCRWRAQYCAAREWVGCRVRKHCQRIRRGGL
jgi:hypothetical protein